MVTNDQEKTISEILSEIRQQYGDAAITDSNRCKGYFSDFAPSHILQKHLLTMFLDCGGSRISTAANDQEAKDLACRIVDQMVSQYPTTLKDARSICAEYASVFGFKVSRSAPRSKSPKRNPPKSEPLRPEPPRPEPPKPEPPKPEPPRPEPPKSAVLKFSDLRLKVKLAFLFGIFVFAYNLWIVNHFVHLGLGYMLFAPLIIVGAGEWYILKSGLPLMQKNKNGKYQGNKVQNGLMLLAFINLVAFLLLQLNAPVDSAQFYVMGSAFLVWGYAFTLEFAATPKEK